MAIPEDRSRPFRPQRPRFDSFAGLTRGGAGTSLPGAPNLSAPGAGTPTSTGTTNAVVTTDQGTGRLYYGVVTNAGSCTDDQLVAGTGGNLVAGSTGNQIIGVSGVQTIPTISGLTTATLYQIKFIQVNTTGTRSAQASVNLTTA